MRCSSQFWHADSPARARLRGRLQPRAVAPRGPGRGPHPHARGRGRPGHARRLLLGLAAARARHVGLRLARRADGRAARRRDPRRPRHRHRVAAALADAPAPGDAAGHPRRPTLSPGGRQAFCPSSPVYREHALALCRALGERYADHPALALWHVSNELGCHNARCYCDVSADAFRTWLRRRYDDDVARLNHAWGTAFWSQRYTDFEQVLPPRIAPAYANPTQQLDFLRFSSDQLLDNFVVERDVLHEVSPGVPVTTNFMVMRQTFADGLPPVGPRARRRLQRPLPHRRRGRRPPRAGVQRRPHPWHRRRPAVAADGALDQRRQLAAPQPRQGARRDDPQQPGARRARRRRGPVLPVARLARRRGEVPLGPAPARRHGHPPVARGLSSSRELLDRSRRSRAACRATRRRSCSTTRRGGAASSTPTPASTSTTATGPRTSTGR